jgi:6-phosphogluconolactonase
LDRSIKIFPSPYELAREFAGFLVDMFKESEKKKRPVTIALSGGSTPEILFSLLGEQYSKSVSWNYVHFFWGDERCVPQESSESNYGMARRKLFDRLSIPYSNVHRIKGENDPEKEALRYSEEIVLNTVRRDGLPMFDLVILGVGEDGHTASIFPASMNLLFSDRICEHVVHPETGQKRITITGRVINNASTVVFLVTGKQKAEIVKKIIKKDPLANSFPAYNIVPVYGELTWYVDREAACLL